VLSCIKVDIDVVMVSSSCNESGTNKVHMLPIVLSCMKQPYYENQYSENKQCSKSKLMFSNNEANVQKTRNDICPNTPNHVTSTVGSQQILKYNSTL
jgi:hypothetical protein